MGNAYSQTFPPSPTLTEHNLPSQSGKVFIVTGGYSGVGLELSKILYNAGGKVYIAGRTESTALSAIEKIKCLPVTSSSATPGELHFLYLDLSNLSTIKASAQEFISKEKRLDVLFNNAGISQPPVGSVSAQGYEAQIGTNCLGPFLFTQLLLSVLKTTAALPGVEPASVRVVWTSSFMVDGFSPAEGIVLEHLTSPPKDNVANYTTSKLGNWYLASELGRRARKDGILSVTQNPGNLRTNLMRERRWVIYALWWLLYEAKMGAYTELWAGLSGELGIQDQGAYVIPWGRKHEWVREDLVGTMKSIEEGGTGRAFEFWKWCEGAVRDYM